MPFDLYDPEDFYDELFVATGKPRSHSVSLIKHMTSLGIEQLEQQRLTAEIALYKLGVTFNVYNDARGVEKIFPFDIIPRIIPAQEWSNLETGLKQRIQALNLFLNDIYGEQKIVTSRKCGSFYRCQSQFNVRFTRRDVPTMASSSFGYGRYGAILRSL